MDCNKNLLEKKYTRDDPNSIKPLNGDTLKDWRPRPADKMTTEAKKLHQWVWVLPLTLKELGFQQIKKLRSDRTYVQANFPVERAFRKGPYEISNTRKQIKDKLPDYDKAICTYADDDVFEEWQKLSDEEKIDYIIEKWQDHSEMNKTFMGNAIEDAFNCYSGRHPEFAYDLDKEELEANVKKDARNSGGEEYLFSGIKPNVEKQTQYVDFKFSLEVTKDNTVWYGLYFNGTQWEGCTLEELEQDWDDFLANEFSNAIGA